MPQLFCYSKTMDRTLYLPSKYRVTTGQGRAGFCTAWSDPELVLKQSPELPSHTSIIGTLYSREGVNVILRNLALNPDIRHILFWGNAPLSKTPFGTMGKEILTALWKVGFDESGKIAGQNFMLHKEFDLDVIRTVIQNVELVDLSEEPLDKATDVAKSIKPGDPYMNPMEFPEHKLEEGQPFPSEKVGFVVRDRSIIGAWTKSIDRVMRYGVVKETEYGNKQRELIALQWVVSDELTPHAEFPDWPDELKKITGASPRAIEGYYPEFLSAELPPGTAYTYGQRMWAYGKNQGFDKTVNQIANIIEHLKDSPVTRRAVATTWDQFIDAKKETKNPPCFVMIQFIQTDGLLHALATFRSHDMFKAAIPNAFGVRRLQEEVARETGFEVGQLSITSNSAHIYEEDWDNATKLLKCAIWEREVSLTFDQNTQSDPRGIVVIRVENNEIIADVGAPDGTTLLTINGKTAKHVFKKLAALDLLSRPDHLMDIGAELEKAEIARDLGIQYKQDQPLHLNERKNS